MQMNIYKNNEKISETFDHGDDIENANFALFKFNIYDHEDKKLFMRMCNVESYVTVLQSLDEQLRSKIKYQPDSMTEEAANAYQECRDMLHELTFDYKVDYEC